MDLDELLQVFRSGKINGLVRYLKPEDRLQPNLDTKLEYWVMPPYKTDEVITPELLATMEEHQYEVMHCLKQSSSLVCVSPDEHRAFYRYTKDYYVPDEPAVVCDKCAEIRQAVLDKGSLTEQMPITLLTAEEEELMQDILHLVQSGAIVIAAVVYDPQVEHHRLHVQGPDPDPDELEKTFLQACDEYLRIGTVLLELTLSNDVRVCSSSEQHRERWHETVLAHSSETVTCCDACAEMRKAMVKRIRAAEGK